MGIQNSATERGLAASMLPPQVGNEQTRLEAVDMLGSLLAPPLLELCREAREHFGCAHVSINLVGAEEVSQQAFAGLPGPGVVQRDTSLCASTIMGEEQREDTHGAMVVLDIEADARCTCMSTREGFYAGVAIKYSNSGPPPQSVGTLCLYDNKARTCFSAGECKKLQEYGEKVTKMLQSPLPSLGEHGEVEHRLNSVEERVHALMVRGGSSCMLVCGLFARSSCPALCVGTCD
jgi:hypothetical protein